MHSLEVIQWFTLSNPDLELATDPTRLYPLEGLHAGRPAEVVTELARDLKYLLERHVLLPDMSFNVGEHPAAAGNLDHPLVTSWRGWVPAGPPYILSGDEALLEPKVRGRWTVTIDSWPAYAGRPDFGADEGGRVHLGLFPMPFAGDLLRARVYLLLLNPGLEPLDYHAEYHVQGFREVMLANLHQGGHGPGMLFLDPTYAWHSGFRYWHGRLTAVIRALAARLGVTYGQARARAQRHVCALELYPYHSDHWALPSKVATRLRSAELARRFVHEALVPRAAAGDATIIVTRQVDAWGLRAGAGVVVYEGMTRRGAHLGPTTLGGAALLEQLAAE